MTINATAVWRVRPSGNNANGGGYDAGISGAGTDYSQQDAAQASGTLGTAAGTTTFTDAGGAFTSAMVGNALWIASGSGFTVGAYFITAFASSTSITLDRSPGTGSVAIWKIGGAWADPKTNIGNTSSGFSWIVPGNQIGIRGSGSNNPTANDYSWTGFTRITDADTTNGPIVFFGENGRPQISSDGLMFIQTTSGGARFKDICFSTSGTSNASFGVLQLVFASFLRCRFDQNGYDISVLLLTTGELVDCEVYSSVAARSTHTAIAITSGAFGLNVTRCNIHDCVSVGVSVLNMASLNNSVIANNPDGNVLCSESVNTTYNTNITRCTISGGGGFGNISINSKTALIGLSLIDNIIANATGTAGIIYSGSGTQAQADRLRKLWSGNQLYNNTLDVSGISAITGSNNNGAGVDPGFTSLSTENYTPTLALVNTVTPLAGNTMSGKASTIDNSLPGAAQLNAAGGSVIAPNVNRTVYIEDAEYAA